MSIRVELNDEIRDALRIPPEEQEGRLRKELALRLYEKGLLSLGKALQVAGMEKWDFLFLLAQEGICRQYDKNEMDRDLAALDRQLETVPHQVSKGGLT
jgi:predicted HTH domain antitoxin